MSCTCSLLNSFSSSCNHSGQGQGLRALAGSRIMLKRNTGSCHVFNSLSQLSFQISEFTQEKTTDSLFGASQQSSRSVVLGKRLAALGTRKF